MLHTATVGALLAILWVALSGYFTVWLLSLGVLSVVAAVVLGRQLGVIDREGYPLHWASRLVRYLPWLLVEIVKSNVDVVKAIARPRMAISPQLLTVKASAKSDIGRVLYANSITLTPGTITVHIDDDTLVVHALTAGGAEGLEGGEMNRRTAWVDSGRGEAGA